MEGTALKKLSTMQPSVLPVSADPNRLQVLFFYSTVISGCLAASESL